MSKWWNVSYVFFKIYLQIFSKDVSMKLVHIDVIVHPVGSAQHVLKQLIIVFLNHVIEMERVSIK
jgi:hypothetical protein